MIDKFQRAWDSHQGTLKDAIKASGADIFSYEALLRLTLAHCFPNPKSGWGDGDPDVDRIHSIDDGDYQGTLVFIVACVGYQPNSYFAFKVSYGSCSGCDTMQSISGYSNNAPDDNQTDALWTLALHMMQGAISF